MNNVNRGWSIMNNMNRDLVIKIKKGIRNNFWLAKFISSIVYFPINMYNVKKIKLFCLCPCISGIPSYFWLLQFVICGFIPHAIFIFITSQTNTNWGRNCSPPFVVLMSLLATKLCLVFRWHERLTITKFSTMELCYTSCYTSVPII